MNFDDILYNKQDGIATITINRPKVLNAFRSQTVDEMVAAFQDAWADRTIGVVILTGVGDRAFSTGGDQSGRDGTTGSDSDLNRRGRRRVARAVAGDRAERVRSRSRTRSIP